MEKVAESHILTICSKCNTFQVIGDLVHDFMNFNALKIANLGWQEPQPTGTAEWPTTLRFGKILGTTSVVRSIENPQDVLQKIHRP